LQKKPNKKKKLNRNKNEKSKLKLDKSSTKKKSIDWVERKRKKRLIKKDKDETKETQNKIIKANNCPNQILFVEYKDPNLIWLFKFIEFEETNTKNDKRAIISIKKIKVNKLVVAKLKATHTNTLTNNIIVSEDS